MNDLIDDILDYSYCIDDEKSKKKKKKKKKKDKKKGSNKKNQETSFDKFLKNSSVNVNICLTDNCVNHIVDTVCSTVDKCCNKNRVQPVAQIEPTENNNSDK